MKYIIYDKPELNKINQDVFDSIKERIESGIEVSDEEIDIFLDRYVYLSRNILKNYLHVDIMEDPLTNRCDLAQHIIGKLLEENENVYVFPKETQNLFGKTCIGHSFLVCVIQNIPYLIDLTYRQFFTKEKCSMDRLINKDNRILKTPDPGFFMLSDDVGKETAKTIIKKGYIRLYLEVAKAYGDSFYFTKTGPVEFKDNSADDYFDLLTEENYEYAVSDKRFEHMYGKVL